ncbi:methyl-accepting chemotaxis protein [Pseudoteredinibacter isoporae]|uniref:Methyl-accepting chemotaxis protein n=1 Tax=Pseudoteredinibacter isoporae TaxID=570281 RepID=A0A7X0JYT6_9GAMM|nr:methyl-accepting chemotaxis protein [Pseudoteredinibacter isoporae]MBB6523776.1 methyl-accepting chemotaxis protein [Pseudoteredinibacter isoporae]NHO89296.1 methyl-accepting chemotaxis protein [Pseudoteredinibacter isoporae]NIB22403.1 methyl-accepting chemotaxis protein [Pseudoteredinibacter isoporae]
MTLRISHRLGILVAMSISVCVIMSLMAWSKIRSEVSFAQNLSKQRLEPVWMLEHLSRLYSHDISDTAHQLRAQMIFWQEAEDIVLEADKRIHEIWQRYESRPLSEAEKSLLEALKPDIETSFATIEELEQKVEEKSSYELGQFVDIKMYAGLKPLYTALDRLIAQQTELAQAEQAAADERLASTTQHILILLGLLIVLQLALSLWLSRSILRPLASMRASVSEIIEEMNFSRRVSVHSDCELGQLGNDVNRMVSVLDDLLASLRPVAITLQDSAKALVGGAKEVDRQVELQNGELQDVNTAVGCVYEAGQDVLRTAESSHKETQAAAEAAEVGAERLQKTILVINELAEHVQRSSTDMSKLSAGSEAIGGVLSVISEIAEQTNLLALNAAIEAARAGDQGRGFAVVADEVRQLAQRTASSTNEIQAMVEAIQKSSEEVSMSLGDSVEAASQSVEQARSTGEIIDEILQGIRLIRGQSQDISQHSKQQIDLSKSLSGQAEKLSELSQQTAKLSEDSSTASEAVSEIATGLSEQLRAYQHSTH